MVLIYHNGERLQVAYIYNTLENPLRDEVRNVVWKFLYPAKRATHF